MGFPQPRCPEGARDSRSLNAPKGRGIPAQGEALGPGRSPPPPQPRGGKASSPRGISPRNGGRHRRCQCPEGARDSSPGRSPGFGSGLPFPPQPRRGATFSPGHAPGFALPRVCPCAGVPRRLHPMAPYSRVPGTLWAMDASGVCGKPMVGVAWLTPTFIEIDINIRGRNTGDPARAGSMQGLPVTGVRRSSTL